MGILALSADERVRDVRVSEDTLTVDLMDGRTIPYPWFGIQDCWMGHRNNGRIGRYAQPVIWPGLDEDLSTEGLLRGAPAPAASARRLTNRSRRRRKARHA